MKKFHVVSIGELLVDMTPAVNAQNNNTVFEVNAGGAPCNVIAMAARLGGRCGFIGKVGSDAFGDMLVKTLDRLGIETTGVVRDGNTPTTLAIVALDEKNDRSFSFYRNPGADQMLRADEVDSELIKNSGIFHFGTMPLSDESSRTAVMHAVSVARENGCMVSFDPNIRMFLWHDEDTLRNMLSYGLANCDVLKMSEEEVTYCTGIQNAEAAMDEVLCRYPSIKIAFLTLGEKGCIVFFNGEKAYAAPVKQKHVVDTTGAGDAFYGVCLYHVASACENELTMEKLLDIARQANAAGSIVTGRRGSMCVMPSNDEICAALK